MSLDFLDDPTLSYVGVDAAQDDSGVSNSTFPVTTAPPDASGGGGSFLQSLLPTLTSGLSATLAAELNANLGAGLQTGLASVDANGNLVYKATPAQTVTPTQVATANAISSLPMILLIGGIAVAALLLLKK